MLDAQERAGDIEGEGDMRYGSVCSGIEAASVAWHGLGWKASFLSEIENFPRAVLSHHYPEVPLHGDFITINAGQYAAIDLLVGGTPCQSFSIAGLRGGLADERGNLALEYLRLAQRLGPRWLVWENVPGVLSSNGGRDFGSILGGLAEIGYGFAYRVLDAQYFGVPQRRRRVFVVGYLGDWRPAAAVLFERESLRRNPAPSKKTRQDTAAISESLSVGSCGTRYGLIPNDCDGVVNSLTANNGQRNEVSDVVNSSVIPWPAKVTCTLNAAFGDKQGLEDQHALSGASLFVPCNSVNEHQSESIKTIIKVRRLTPRECERLQGFPDDWTDIPYKGKQAPDGPRYKALGNSMAVPVMRWIGERIACVENMLNAA